VKVNFPFIEENGRVGVECSACGQRFFDRMSKGARSRMLQSGISVAIDHANSRHRSTGGVIGRRAVTSVEKRAAAFDA